MTLSTRASEVRFDADQMWGAGRRPHPWHSARLVPAPVPREGRANRRRFASAEWPTLGTLDEDISIAGLLAGRDDQAALRKSAA